MKLSPHITSAFTALVACTLLSVINLITAIHNDWSGSTGYGTSRAMETIPFHLIFASLYWLTCLWKVPVRPSLRLPVLLMLFWCWMAMGAWNDNAIHQMATWDLFDAVLSPFCFLLWPMERSFGHLLRADPILHLFGLYIGFIFVYKVVVLEAAAWIAKRLLNPHPSLRNQKSTILI